jgi:nucleoid-associated protein YgaU
MPDSFPPVSDDIAFELLILHAVAERGHSLKGPRATALRSSLLWDVPGPQRRAATGKKALMQVASALVIASTLSLTPSTALPAWAQRQSTRITVVDVQTGKPLADVVLRDDHGNALARTRADGKIAFTVPGGSQRFILERAGYQTISLNPAQLGGSNLVSMRKTGAQVAPSPRPTAKPSTRGTIKPTARPTIKPTTKPTAKPTAKPVSKPTFKPTAKPAVTVTPTPARPPQAAPAPQREPQVRRPAATPGGRYVVKRGDTLWDIAAVTLGNPAKWPSLYEANRGTLTRPSLIHPGQTLVIPARTAATPRFRGTHTVSRGDTLWDIAGRVYGDPLRWKALYQANRGIIKRPSMIYPGQTLLLPR